MTSDSPSVSQPPFSGVSRVGYYVYYRQHDAPFTSISNAPSASKNFSIAQSQTVANVQDELVYYAGSQQASESIEERRSYIRGVAGELRHKMSRTVIDDIEDATGLERIQINGANRRGLGCSRLRTWKYRW